MRCRIAGGLAVALLLTAGCTERPDSAAGQAPCGVAGMTVCPMPFDKDLPAVKDMLTWNQAQRAVGFRNDYRAYPGDLFRHGGDVTALPKAARQVTDVSYRVGEKTYRLADYLERQSVSGLLVLKDGKIAYEFYGNGNTASTLWTSRSVGKSVVSTLVGIALKEGAIGSLDDPITKYEPDLTGTAWDGVNLRQLITHTSGIDWNEDYTDPASDFAKLTQCEAGSDTYDCVSKLVHGLKRKPGVAPGQVWSYTTGGAWLLGDVLERATGKPLAAYLEEKLWKPFGMADDGVWHSYELGKHDMGGHGFNATLQDWGRFGLFMLRDGALPDGRKILPDGWVHDAQTWTRAQGSVTAAHPDGTYGYQWWNNRLPVDGGDIAPKSSPDMDAGMWALGIFGQIIAVNQKENLVMVQWSTWDKAEPSFSAQPLEASLLFNSFADALR